MADNGRRPARRRVDTSDFGRMNVLRAVLSAMRARRSGYRRSHRAAAKVAAALHGLLKSS